MRKSLTSWSRLVDHLEDMYASVHGHMVLGVMVFQLMSKIFAIPKSVTSALLPAMRRTLLLERYDTIRVEVGKGQGYVMAKVH